MFAHDRYFTIYVTVQCKFTEKQTVFIFVTYYEKRPCTVFQCRPILVLLFWTIIYNIHIIAIHFIKIYMQLFCLHPPDLLSSTPLGHPVGRPDLCTVHNFTHQAFVIVSMGTVAFCIVFHDIFITRHKLVRCEEY